MRAVGLYSFGVMYNELFAFIRILYLMPTAIQAGTSRDY